MATPQGVWGIDIGQCALKAIRVELVDGQVTATAFDYVEHPKILSQPDADPDQLTRESLEQFLSRNHLKGDMVCIAVPGQSGLARFVKLPPVEEKKILDIVKFEAKQQIPFPLEEVVWDYQKIGSGEVTDGFALETEIGLFAMKRDMIARSLTHYQDVGVEVDIVQMAPLALCNFVSFELLNKGGTATEPDQADDTPRGKRKCIVGLDIGADSSNLVVTDGEKVIWQRPIPLGGNHLTRALSKELKLTFAKAEHLKRNAAKSPPDLKQILAALKPVLTDLVGEVQRSLGYFTNSHREAHVAYVVGLGSAFRLPGLQKYLSEKLQVDVRKPSKFTRLVGDEVVTAPVFAENILSYAVAYGLAVQGLKVSRLSTNLLPPEIRQDRQIRGKKPWALAAAVALFLGTAAMTGGYAWSYKAVNAQPIEEAMKAGKQAKDRAAARDAEIATKLTELNTTRDAVLSIVAGSYEQRDWLKINEYVNLCLPQPDGKNLELTGRPTIKPGGQPDEFVPDQRRYWALDKAKEAYLDYRARLSGDESADVPMDEVLRENLCHVDVEVVHTYFTPNGRQFFDAAKISTREFAGKEFDGMLQFDRDNPPKDEGVWAVAIHGSTFQKDGPIFLTDCLNYNLARMCRRNFGAAGSTTPPSDGKTPEDPITDRVTHAFLYNSWRINDPKPGVSDKLSVNYLRPLVNTGGAAGASKVGADDAAASSAPPSRDAWVPLGNVTAAVSADQNVGRFGFKPPSAGDMKLGGLGSGGQKLGTPDPAVDLTAPKSKPRYDFVIMFLWREPTPSDKLSSPTIP